MLLWCFVCENTFCLNDLKGKRTKGVFLVYLSNCKGNSSINATGFKLFLWQLNFTDYFSSFNKLVCEDALFPLSIITLSDSSSRQRSLWSKEKWFERRKAQDWTQALFMCLETGGGINVLSKVHLGYSFWKHFSKLIKGEHFRDCLKQSFTRHLRWYRKMDSCGAWKFMSAHLFENKTNQKLD